MTDPRSPGTRGTRGVGTEATTTSIDLDTAEVVVTAHRFAWSDVPEVRDELLKHVHRPGVALRLDLSRMPEDDVSGLWVNALVRTHRRARRSGCTLVVVGAPKLLAAILDRLHVTLLQP
ncbi:MAG: hypothetical protein JWM02_3541 [Frankiales bacterium]|nr:hypothetical protein [Frankiales bacterium]